MPESIFDFHDYKKCVQYLLTARSKTGARTALAKAAECQSGYITQVLNGSAHFSLEQALKISRHFGLNDDQSQFFLDLVSYGRAGTEELRRHFRHKLDAARVQQAVLKNRFKEQDKLNPSDEAMFYSSWHYGALHVATTLPNCRTELGMSEHFGIPLQRVNEVVQCLERTGLLVRDRRGLQIGPTEIFIGSGSPLISKFHTNWRMQAIQSLDRYSERDLHYSSVLTASFEDIARIREMMVKLIEQIRQIIRDSKDEGCFSYGFDLFELKK